MNKQTKIDIIRKLAVGLGILSLILPHYYGTVLDNWLGIWTLGFFAGSGGISFSTKFLVVGIIIGIGVIVTAMFPKCSNKPRLCGIGGGIFIILGSFLSLISGITYILLNMSLSVGFYLAISSGFLSIIAIILLKKRRKNP